MRTSPGTAVRSRFAWRNVVALVLGATTAGNGLSGEPAGATTSGTPARAIARSELLAPPALREVRLSGDGRHVAWLLDVDDARSLWLMDTTSGEPTGLLVRTDATHLHWARDARTLYLESPTQLSVVTIDDRGGARVLSRFDDEVAYEISGSDRAHEDALVVIERTATNGPSPRSRVVRVDPRGTRHVLAQATLPITDVVLDTRGHVAFLKRIEGKGHAIVRLDDRDGGDGDRGTVVQRCARLHRCTLVAALADGALLMQSDLGASRSGLVSLERDGALRVLHDDPYREADLDALSLDPRSDEPLFAAYRSTSPRIHALNDEAATHWRDIDAALPRRDLAIDVGIGRAARWLVAERDSTLQQPRWHLYDPSSRTLRRILAELPGVEPAIEEEALARKDAVTWRGSDGMLLHGFVTRPTGLDPARVPLVVNVHGGPWSRTTPGFNPLTQLLANRGYAVFEPNFRGSTGFGRDVLFAANGDFGNGRVQLDIVEGTRAVLSAGTGDAQRVAIVGASFGGYSALLGTTFFPQLFRAAAAAVPPSDFGWTARWATAHSDLADSPGIALIDRFRMLDVDVDDASTLARLHAQSPLANAGLLTRPVVLFAGGIDERVAFRSVSHYAATLRTLGKDVSLFVEPQAGHAADAPLMRESWFLLVERLLHATIGGTAPVPPGPALQAYLERSLRLRGPALSDD